MAARVLVVDYQPTIVYTLALVLRASGYEVKTEHSGEVALAIAMEWEPDLLIIEFIPADMNGLESLTKTTNRAHQALWSSILNVT